MSDTWLQSFEGHLEHLEQQVRRGDISLTTLHQHADAALRSLAAVSNTEIWVIQGEQVSCLSMHGPQPLFSESQIRAADQHSGVFAAGDDNHEHYLPYHFLAEQVCCLYAITFTDLIAPRQSFAEGAQAVVEIVSGQLSHYLLSQFQTQLQQQANMTSLVSRLHESTTLKDAADVVVQEGSTLLGNVRLSLVTRNESGGSAVAMTGVRTPLPEAETVRAVCRVACSWPPDQHPEEQWLNLADADGCEPGCDVLANGGVNAIRCLPLQTALSSQRANAVSLVAETFDSDTLPDEYLLQQLVRVSGPVLNSRYERERTLKDRLLRVPGRRRWIWAAAAFAALWLVPMRFEIEVPGRLAAADRRRIYAPDEGTIDDVRFRHEGSVHTDDVILRLSNPKLTLSQQRLQGEIATSATQLASVQALRLSSADPQLSREERRLTQQLESLREQFRLVSGQIEELSIKSPCDGTAFRPDAGRDLMAQPVQRGQLLAEVVPQDSEWQLDLKIPDRVRSYIVQYRDSADEAPVVRYLIVSSAQRDWTTRLTNVDNAVQIEDGELICRATARLTTPPEGDLHPGTSVVARIHCGTASVGFVMFREIIEFCHRIRFAWF